MSLLLLSGVKQNPKPLTIRLTLFFRLHEQSWQVSSMSFTTDSWTTFSKNWESSEEHSSYRASVGKVQFTVNEILQIAHASRKLALQTDADMQDV